MRKTLSIILLGLAVLYLPNRTFAHGGGRIQIVNAEVGECESSVWLNPPNPRANDILHLTVGISDADRNPNLDSEVEILLMRDGQVVTTEFAKTENSVNRLFYEADLGDQTVGIYDVVLMYRNEGCSGQLSFPMQVTADSYVRFYVVGLFVLVGGYFVVRRGRQGANAQKPQRRHSEMSKRP